MIPSCVRDEVTLASGARVTDAETVGGGDVNQARRLRLADGRGAFLKFHEGGDADMFPAEAKGLAWLREPGHLRLPTVLAVSRHDAEVPWLLMEDLGEGRPAADHDERLGRGLASLHGCAPFAFGLDHDNYIGTLPQANGGADSWPEFYGRWRLRPQIERAHGHGVMPDSLRRRLERLVERLDELSGPPEPPARLHGDLWSGNAHVAADGAPALLDPAVYGGHREMDLAMMRLFSGFSQRVFDAYQEARPLASGWEDRVPLCQLYPLLVHVNLFGASYLPGLEQAARRWD